MCLVLKGMGRVKEGLSLLLPFHSIDPETISVFLEKFTIF